MPLKNCPACQSQVSVEAPLCVHCGHPLQPKDSTQLHINRSFIGLLGFLCAVAAFALITGLHSWYIHKSAEALFAPMVKAIPIGAIVVGALFFPLLGFIWCLRNWHVVAVLILVVWLGALLNALMTAIAIVLVGLLFGHPAWHRWLGPGGIGKVHLAAQVAGVVLFPFLLVFCRLRGGNSFISQHKSVVVERLHLPSDKGTS
ncbi:MAG: hypothetical protein ACFCD0_20390 [Gemmataceae bacterium]